MERTVTKINPAGVVLPKKKRVAAYARVSSGKDAMLHSLSAQVSYYSDYIQKHPGWEYVGVYADEALTGTKENRAEFQRLLADCRAGNVEMILTKSISRFARNTLTLLETVRELKSLGIDVYFEKENLHSISGDGELMLSILASFAQEESRSVSENCKWRIRDSFKQGIIPSITILGYRRNAQGVLEVEPKEAKIVRMIFSDYLSGMGRQAIANKLNATGILTRRGTEWHSSTVNCILSDEKYTGNMVLQKTFRENHISKKKKYNKGELPRYSVQHCHKPVIDHAIFDAVQEEKKRRAAKFTPHNFKTVYPYSGKIVCGKCGKNYRRKLTGAKSSKYVWICSTFNDKGKSACDSRQIPENTLMELTAEVLELPKFDKGVFEQKIERILVTGSSELAFVFMNGQTVTKTWQNKSRKDSWTDAMRNAAAERMRRRNEICNQL